ncbi:deoxyribose-phosphate aldolase [Sinanaerobacter sp. ZZT-01]|uniref:deoxyribose-phosphate aldolase n=1 Tax=Sinanaerobacter sp. ZZT-01 TaxID=3111540 RepID=UPI002D796915|nr:deoxyribose-phosphate aldolase [Sinanaerobacter sp. ZZT-01]WRR92188.1 deoxyribose-phosphate aldolase [Sinanaerobacter sp. ZZT-01]
MKRYNGYFDHTLLKADATEKEILQICEEAKKYEFYAICVNACYISFAKKQLIDSKVKIASVIGFPLGACGTETKVFETKWACSQGAEEIDMVIAVGALKDGRLDFVREDIRKVVETAKQSNAIVKVILETCLLNDTEIVIGCHLAEEAGAAFVKTSTGFSSGGATVHHVELMKKTVGSSMQIKASGGIRTLETMKKMIEAGADRIGASASVAILKENEEKDS